MDKPDIEQNTIILDIDEVTELIRSPDVFVRERAIEKLALFGLRFLRKEALIGQQIESSETRDNDKETASLSMVIQEHEEALTKLAKERKQLEIEKQTLQNYLEGAGAGTWQLDVVSGKEIFDELSATMTGYSLEELLDPDNGVTWDSIVYPDDLKKSKEQLQKCIDGETDSYVCELRIKRKDGSEVWVEDKGKVFERDENDNALRMLGTTIDITGRKQLEEEVIGLTLHDELTGLGNRRYLRQELDKLEQSGRKNPISIISMDIFDFKRINDTYGHDAGDEVLRTISGILKDVFRPDDCIVRMGGDEFVAVLPLTNEKDAQSIKTRIEKRLTMDVSKYPVKLSVGVATAIDKTDDLGDLLTLADQMMYKHKKSQKIIQ